jgi:DNA-binding transcriptional regulator YbjK
VTNRAVAARARVWPGALSYHFRSQTELGPLAAAVQEVVEGADRRVLAALVRAAA